MTNAAPRGGVVVTSLGSLKLTLVILILLATGILVSYNSEVRTTWALVVPLFLFAVNLFVAIAINPVFRRQTALLVFHVALVAIVLLVAAGRLTYFKAKLELTEGVPFDGQPVEYESGPWHWGGLDQISFVNEGFGIRYEIGMQRDKTWNRVRWIDENGNQQQTIIGDQRPLVVHGYRIYTTPNKGFAPVFAWYPKGPGEPVLGTVHLPSYPVRQYEQAREWTLPGVDKPLWTKLQFDEVLIDPAKPSEFQLPRDHRLVIRVGDDRRELKPGERYELKEGTLVYQGLRTWMGYTVFYDWTIPWLLAACVVAVGSLSWHFWNKFAAKPWQDTPSGDTTENGIRA